MMKFVALFLIGIFTFSSHASNEPIGVEAAQVLTYPGTIELNPLDFQKIASISDIHGMFHPFRQLLQNAHLIDANATWIGGKTLLLIVGDSIDKGPQSLEVMDLIIKMQKDALSSGGKVVQLLGNHEAEFLADPANKKAAELLAELSQKHVPVSDLTSDQTLYGQFLHSEPLAAKVGKWLFCHSGHYPDMSWTDFSKKAQQTLTSRNYVDDFLIGDDSVLEARDWYKTPEGRKEQMDILSREGFYGLVFGHQPGAFGITARSAAVEAGRIIKIDNGMSPEAGSNPGSLMVFQNPSEMNQAIFPSIEVFDFDGPSHTLTPESPVCAVEDDALHHCK